MKRYLEAFLGVLVFIDIALIGECCIKYYNVQEIVYYELLIGVLMALIIQLLLNIIIKRRWKFAAFLIITFLFEVALFIKGSGILSVILRFCEDLNFLYDKCYYSQIINYTEFRWTLLFIILLIALFVGILAFNVRRNSLIYLNLFFSLMLWYGNGTEIVKKYLILFVMICTAIYMIEKMIPVLKDFKRNRKTSLIFWSLIVVVFIGLGVRVLPSKKYGKEFFGIHRFINNEYAPVKGIDKISYNDVYRFGDANRGGKNKLGGKIKQDSKKIIEIKGQGVKYLKSSSKISYDGEYWFNSSSHYKRMKNNKRFSGELKNFEKKESQIVEIKYDKNFQTKSVFSPGFSQEYMIDDEIYYDENSTSILKLHDDIDKYKVKKIVLKSKKTGLILPEIFSEMSHGSSQVFNYSIPVEIIKNERDAESYLKKYMEMEQYKNYDVETQINNLTVFEEYLKYLKLPSNISDRVYDLTYEVIEGASTPYEKISRIRSYLKNNYPYTLDVNEIPDRHEFVDYFLFEEKQGYCTYYATAMAIMGRIAGIPTRYCEGFKVDQINALYNGESRQSIKGYFVKTDNAHAWVEVLVDPEDDIWSVVEATGSEDTDEEDTEEIMYKNQGNGEEQTGDFLNRDNIKRDSKDSKDSQGLTDDIDSNEKEDNRNFYILFKLILCCIPLKLLYDIFRRLSTMNCNSASQIYYYALKRLKRVKIKKDPYESEVEFAEKIINEDLRNTMTELVRLGCEESYGIKIEYSSKAHYKQINKYVRERRGVLLDTIIRVVLGE